MLDWGAGVGLGEGVVAPGLGGRLVFGGWVGGYINPCFPLSSDVLEKGGGSPCQNWKK